MLFYQNSVTIGVVPDILKCGRTDGNSRRLSNEEVDPSIKSFDSPRVRSASSRICLARAAIPSTDSDEISTDVLRNSRSSNDPSGQRSTTLLKQPISSTHETASNAGQSKTQIKEPIISREPDQQGWKKTGPSRITGMPSFDTFPHLKPLPYQFSSDEDSEGEDPTPICPEPTPVPPNIPAVGGGCDGSESDGPPSRPIVVGKLEKPQIFI